MQFKKRVLNLLQVRDSEWWLVRQLFFQQFFSGAGIALFFTASFTLFLQKFNIAELPKVLIASAFLQWLTGFIYSKVEHLFSIKTLILVVNIFIAASMILFRILAGYTDSIFFYFSMLVWYNVLYLLSSLDFWGLAALLFDVRQSKRLFGIISAGDIPAKFIGYTSAYILAPFIGTLNMIVAGGVAVLFSLVYWDRLKRSGHLDIKLHHHHEEQQSRKKNESFTEAVFRFFENKLVFNLAVLSFLISSISTLIYFIFYSKIKSASHSNELLASYIPLFLAFSRLIAIILKLFFTNRITNALGIRGSLLISPIILFLILITVFFMPMLSEGAKMILLIFGLLSVVNDALRSAILTPVFLSIMQPLRAQVRLRAHNIIKGVMDPFGFLFVGSLLYLMLVYEHNIDLYQLSYVLFGLLVVSIIWIFIINAEYSKMLVEALRNRYFNGNEMEIDRESLAFFLKKSKSGDAADVIFVLNLIGKNRSDDALKIIDNAMHHADDHVKIEAIKTIERMHLVSNIEQMKAIAASTVNPELLFEVIKAIYTIADDENYTDYIERGDDQLVCAAVIGMLRNEKLSIRGVRYLKMMATSSETDQRMFAIRIIAANPRHSFHKELISLIKDKEEEVSRAAIKIAGKLHSNEIAEELLKILPGSLHEKLILNALSENGNHTIAALNNYMQNVKTSFSLRVKLISIIGKIGGESSKKLLDNLIDSEPECRNKIIESLHLANFKVNKLNDKKYRQIINSLLDEAAQLVLDIELLLAQGKYPLLKRALELEMNIYRDVILNVFTFFYESDKIKHARTVFFLNKKESIANALEIIEVTVQKETALKFIELYDTNAIEQKAIGVRKYFNVQSHTMENLLKVILQPTSLYNRWTRSCALYELDNVTKQKYESTIKELSLIDDFLIKETANYVLEKA